MDGWLGICNTYSVNSYGNKLDSKNDHFGSGLFTNDVINLKHQGACQKLMIGWHKHQGVSETPKNADVICEQPLRKKLNKSHPQKRFNIWVSSKWHIFWFLNFVFFVHNSLQKPFQYKMIGVFLKIQEIYSQMGTKILKIYWELSEIMELKVGNPKNSVSRNWAILSHPWNLTFFHDKIFQFFSWSYG